MCNRVRINIRQKNSVAVRLDGCEPKQLTTKNIQFYRTLIFILLIMLF